jgi:hypothetical protein
MLSVLMCTENTEEHLLKAVSGILIELLQYVMQYVTLSNTSDCHVSHLKVDQYKTSGIPETINIISPTEEYDQTFWQLGRMCSFAALFVPSFLLFWVLKNPLKCNHTSYLKKTLSQTLTLLQTSCQKH